MFICEKYLLEKVKKKKETKGKIFFLYTENRPEHFPEISEKDMKKMKKYWHCGVVYDGEVRECFNGGKHMISDKSRLDMPSFREAEFVTYPIEKSKLESQIKLGCKAGEYVARVIGLSGNIGPLSTHYPIDVYKTVSKL